MSSVISADKLLEDIQPWEGLLILRLNDKVSIYKASRVALKQAIPEIEKKYKLEVEILDRSFLET